MRTMDISLSCLSADGAEPTPANRLRLVAELLSYLTWPNDRASRQAYLRCPRIPAVFEGGRIEADVPATPSSDGFMRNGFPDVESPEDDVPTLEQRLGRAAVRAAIRASTREWHTAGLQFLTYCRMATHHAVDLKHGPSLAKATQIMEDHYKCSRTIAANAWKTHGCVAHIGAAVVLVAIRHLAKTSINDRHAPYMLEWSLQTCPIRTLRIAASLQTFGLSSANARSSSSGIVSADTLWHVPSIVGDDDAIEGLSPLTDRQLGLVTV